MRAAEVLQDRLATGLDKIYCWDISYLPTEVRGILFYLYLFAALFSRQIVGCQLYDCEGVEQASCQQRQPLLGGPVKGTEVPASNARQTVL